MIVMKFGGTSVQDAGAIRRVAEIVRRHAERKVLVVVSACAGVTDQLVRLSQAIERRDEAAIGKIKETLIDKHKMEAQTLTLSAEEKEQLERFNGEFERCVNGASILREVTPRTHDRLLSFGELWSSVLTLSAIRQTGQSISWLDARTVITTDNAYNAAHPQTDALPLQVQQKIIPALERGIVITQGFLGATRDGHTTTLGRGGSDYSASLLGASLKADEIQIWTDVDGILTTDPRLVHVARQLTHVSFDEATELSQFGAKVLHPKTVLPAIQKNIPIRVLNTFNPSNAGTCITREAIKGKGIVRSIAFKRGLEVMTVRFNDPEQKSPILAEIFARLQEAGTDVELVNTTERGIVLAAASNERWRVFCDHLPASWHITFQTGRALCALVGHLIAEDFSNLTRALSVMQSEAIHVEAIAQGGSGHHWAVLLREHQLTPAVRLLHADFFENRASGQTVAVA